MGKQRRRARKPLPVQPVRPIPGAAAGRSASQRKVLWLAIGLWAAGVLVYELATGYRDPAAAASNFALVAGIPALANLVIERWDERRRR